MRRVLFLGCGIVMLCLLPSAMGAERDPNALPPGAVARLGWSPLRIGYSAFALAPDGRTIIVVTAEGNLRRLDAQTGRLLERRQLSERGDVDSLRGSYARLSANGQAVALDEWSYAGFRVTVYDVASGKKIFRRASTEKNHVLFGTLSPDGKQLAVLESENSSNRPARLRVFDLTTKRRHDLGTFEHEMLTLHFSGDGKRLLVVQYLPEPSLGSTMPLVNQNLVLQFDLSSDKELWRRTVWGEHFAISHDGRLVLASGFRNREGRDSGFHVLERDADSGKLTERFVSCRPGSNSSPQAIDFLGDYVLAADNHTIVINHLDEILLWDLRGRKVVRRFQLPKTDDTYFSSSMATSADGRTLLLTKGAYLQRLDLTTGKSYFVLPDNGLPGSCLQRAFTPDSKEVLASSYSGMTGRWNTATGKRIELTQDNYGGSPFIQTPEGLRTVRYECRHRQMEYTVFDPIARKLLHTVRFIDPNQLDAPNDRVDRPTRQAYALTANGKTLLAIHTGVKNNHVTAWNVRTGKCLSHFRVPNRIDFPSSPFSPCGRWMVMNGELYHAGSGSELFAPAGLPGERLICGNQRAHGSVWFSEDGRLMAAHLRNKEAKTAVEDALAVWELASGQILARFPKDGFVAQAAFAPDNRTIALLDAHGVRLADLWSGKLLATYAAPDVIGGPVDHVGLRQGVVFAPDGAALATAHKDGTLMLWKVPRSRNPHSAALAEAGVTRFSGGVSGGGGGRGGEPPENLVTPAEAEAQKQWTDLGSSSPATARRAIEQLACNPDAASALLVRRFCPPFDEVKFQALINDLDNDEFARREEASRQLRAHGAKAEAALRRRLTQAPPLEMRRRLESILADLKPLPLRLPLAAERLRAVRAIEVLERIGNTPARQLLQTWAEQTEDGQLAVEARLALERLGPANAKTIPAKNKQLP